MPNGKFGIRINMMDKNKIGNYLKKLRVEKGLSQEKLSEALEPTCGIISATNISKWETGKTIPQLDTLRYIAEFYNVTLDDILNHKTINIELIDKDLDYEDNLIDNSLSKEEKLYLVDRHEKLIKKLILEGLNGREYEDLNETLVAYVINRKRVQKLPNKAKKSDFDLICFDIRRMLIEHEDWTYEQKKNYIDKYFINFNYTTKEIIHTYLDCLNRNDLREYEKLMHSFNNQILDELLVSTLTISAIDLKKLYRGISFSNDFYKKLCAFQRDLINRGAKLNKIFAPKHVVKCCRISIPIKLISYYIDIMESTIINEYAMEDLTFDDMIYFNSQNKIEEYERLFSKTGLQDYKRSVYREVDKYYELLEKLKNNEDVQFIDEKIYQGNADKFIDIDILEGIAMGVEHDEYENGYLEKETQELYNVLEEESFYKIRDKYYKYLGEI